MHNNLLDSYVSARRVLSGNNDAGLKVFPGMFDSDVVSLSHGDGTRRADVGTISAGILALLDSRYSPDDYHVMTHNEELEKWISDDFRSDGIPGNIAENILITQGSTSLFDAIFTYYIGKNRRYLVPSSFYHNLVKWSSLYQEKLICKYTSAANDYKLSAEELRESVTEDDIDTLFLFNPTQTGAIYTDEELKALSEVCIEKGLTVYVDSVFAGTEFEPDVRTPQMARYFEASPDSIVTIKSASKFLNLANMRVGWACGGQEIISALKDICSAKNPSMSNVALEMVRYGVLHCHDYIRANNNECSRRADIISESVTSINNALGEEVVRIGHKPGAGHGFLLDFDHLSTMSGSKVKTGCDLVAYLLKESRVAFSPADSLGFRGCKVRIAYSSVGLKSTYLDGELERKIALESIRTGCVPVRTHHDHTVHFAKGREILQKSLNVDLLNALYTLLRK